MELHEAKDLLPKFAHLKNEYSPSYNAGISEIFITFRYQVLAYSHYHTTVKFNVWWAPLDWDNGNYTIAAALNNDKVVCIRDLVINDKREELFGHLKKVPFMVPAPAELIREYTEY